ncbi:uncharacterized protein K441DRAFT_298342 [Cenococcum geophilum 1.58]|uniref:uncharacterized protein n=1 Tax=Cenococcum geophilum 1.58 TaxID=794803 RepID=UPI00358E00AE|nr:hypothetical protein K441DRAFT_298342 [Cenococcum geophilum 1.58]
MCRPYTVEICVVFLVYYCCVLVELLQSSALNPELVRKASSLPEQNFWRFVAIATGAFFS